MVNEMNITEILTLLISSGSLIAIFTLIFKMGKYAQKIDGLDLKINELAKHTNERFDKIDQRFDKIDQRFEKYEFEIKQEFKEVKSELSNLRERIVKIEWVADTLKSLLRINVTSEEPKASESKYLKKETLEKK